MALVHLNFQSQYLGNNTDVNIILPDKPMPAEPQSFYSSGEKYRTLYLLHGTFGDYTDWLRKSNIETYAAERRLIVVEDSGFFKNKCDELADYIPGIPSTTCLLFVETEVDKRSRLYKAVKSCGRAVEFQVQDERTLMKWVLSILRKERKQISEPALHLFLERTGTDMERISSELEKLLSYTLGREGITAGDVEEICAVQVSNRIFEMIRAIAEKNQKKALDLYYDLLALKEPSLRILALIARQFNQLLLIKSLTAKGYDKNTVADKAKLSPYIAGRCMTQAKSFSLERLKEAVRDCAESEEAVKTGRISDVMSVELLILKYSQ